MAGRLLLAVAGSVLLGIGALVNGAMIAGHLFLRLIGALDAALVGNEGRTVGSCRQRPLPASSSRNRSRSRSPYVEISQVATTGLFVTWPPLPAPGQ